MLFKINSGFIQRFRCFKSLLIFFHKRFKTNGYVLKITVKKFLVTLEFRFTL